MSESQAENKALLHYPFGMLMPGRNFSSETYRFGFQNQEKDDEIAGEGNSNTAEYWQYDTRLGKRWNVDPRSSEGISPYACFKNSPIFIVDPLGDTTTYFDMRGRRLGTINDHLENQIHFVDRKTFKQVIAISETLVKNNVISKGITPDISSEYLRRESSAFIGKGTIASLEDIKTEGNEMGGILIVSPTREILAIDKSSEVEQAGGIRSSNKFATPLLPDVTSKTERQNLFGFFHTHPRDNYSPTNYQDSKWQGWDRYNTPDDYYSPFMNNGRANGGHPAVIVTQNYISVYGTLTTKLNQYTRPPRQLPQSDNKDIAGRYTLFKRSFFNR